jgi:hypothetical protein
MPPTGTPVTEQVVDKLVTLMGTLTAGGDYYTTVRKVVVFEPETLLTATDYFVAILPTGSDFENERLRNVGEYQNTMDLRIFLVMKTATDVMSKLLRFERDAMKALIDDHTLSGLVLRSDITGSSHRIGDDRQAISFTELNLRVKFRTPRTDLNTST